MERRSGPTLSWLTMVAVVVMAALVLSLAPTVSAKTASGFESGVRSRTNGVRSDHDVAKLRKQSCVQKHAVRQARRMAKQEKMFHQDLEPVLKDCSLRLVGENVAYGYSSAGAVVRAWMDSAPHRANIVKKRYRLIGVGARKSASGTWYLAQVFGRA